ncbi:MAG: DUF87 domain-containing protein [Proteobacteria bacterium]|nr:DUF87 domain-containing protein [Pseudomonadota bacterium]
MTELEKGFVEKQQNILSDAAKKWFKRLVQPSQYVGEVYSISYETALVQIHDHHRQKVGGIPSLSFLIATRIVNPDQEINHELEDSSIVLLRVMDAASLPNDVEAERIRVQSAQRVSGEFEQHWDNPETMDAQTHNLLSFAGIKCRVLGTFFLEHNPREPNSPLVLRFGSDISNYYPNKGLKVFKPNSGALKEIVNYQDLDRRLDLRNHSRVPIGEIRYASTNRPFQGVSNVDVSISPADLLDQKTALFGMTRTGKSNTTKIIAKSVFELRFDAKEPLRIGQIIFDPNGEYANQNVQDADNKKNPQALKNVWQANKQGEKKDVVTYGIRSHPDDPERKLMLINFYDDSMLQTGKEMIDTALADFGSQYVINFRLVEFNKPDPKFYDDKEYPGELTRYNRRVLAYRTLLKRAGFEVPSGLLPVTDRLFSKDLVETMQNFSSTRKEQEREQAIKTAAAILSSRPSWDALATAFEGLWYFLRTDAYTAFNTAYIKGSSTGQGWADADLDRLLEMFAHPKATNLLGIVKDQHTANVKTDYAADIYNDLVAGRLVIVDQSSGEPKVNDSAARRIMWKIFKENQSLFRQGKFPPDILVYVEEAHTLLPSEKENDYNDVWVRTAKEGAKYRIGMVYVTQEVSSIQRNILKNTANWFIGHLNNTDETRELRKFYDFADFESSIIRAQDRGFLRVKTLSNPFVIPVQIKPFEV